MECPKCKHLILDTFAFCPHCGVSLKVPQPKVKEIRKRRPKGSGGIRELSGKRSKPFEATKCSVSLGTFETWDEADRFLSNLGGADPALKKLTLKQIYDRYQKSQAYLSLTDRSKKNIILAWSKLSAIAQLKACDIKTDRKSVV